MIHGDENDRIDLSGLTYAQLVGWLKENTDLKEYRAGQIFSWIHLRRATSFNEMTNVSLTAREMLEASADITVLDIEKTLSSSDGTTKFSFRLGDGSLIESVLLPDPPRLTACLSTQVGCRFACTFCQTGKMGFSRNLSSGEIVAQLYGLQNSTSNRISNIVFMGMGEPMDNFPQLETSLSIITDDRGICIGARKITISTVGLPGGIERLTGLQGQYGLAVSLHSAVEGTRNMLIPASKALPLKRLKGELIDYCRAKNRRITLEYCLIGGINDSIEQADALVEFASGIECKINLLVYNKIDGGVHHSPDSDTVEVFMHYLYPRCQAVTFRRSRGTEIAAACGQLGCGKT